VKVQKSLDEYFGFMNDLDRRLVFSLYNSITAGFDHHTTYFAPEEKERFDVSISGRLGIGALQRKMTLPKFLN
jgi:carboxyl-terminal processing protease